MKSERHPFLRIRENLKKERMFFLLEKEGKRVQMLFEGLR